MRVLGLILFLFSFSAKAELAGTYVGCGHSKTFGGRPVIFQLVKIPTGFEASEFQYSVAFSLYGGSAIYFPEIKFNSDSTKMFMRTEIRPTREYGLILNTLTVTILPDGALSGLYETNSMNSEGYVLRGEWLASKVDSENIPKLKCN